MISHFASYLGYVGQRIKKSFKYICVASYSGYVGPRIKKSFKYICVASYFQGMLDHE